MKDATLKKVNASLTWGMRIGMFAVMGYIFWITETGELTTKGAAFLALYLALIHWWKELWK